MDVWMRNSWHFQQQMFQQLGDRKWDRLDGDSKLLSDKVEYAFELCYGVNYRRVEKLKKTTDKVLSAVLKAFNGELSTTRAKFCDLFACTFLELRMVKRGYRGRYCIFYLASDGEGEGEECCVDLSGRFYKSWSDFLNNNKLPQCYIMYPESGRYFNERNDDNFIDIICEKSISCGFKSNLKDVVDTVSTIGSIGAAGVLICNPVGASLLLGAGAVTLLTSAYTVGSGVSRLVDIHEHEGGLSIKDSKTLLTVSEITLTTVGAAAVGASAGIKGVAAKTGRVLSEGQMMCKLAGNVGLISRVNCGVNVFLNFFIVVDNYRNGDLSRSDLHRVSKILFFSFFVVVPECILIEFVELVASTFSGNGIINYFMQSPRRLQSLIREVSNFRDAQGVQELMTLLFPNFFIIDTKISDSIVLLRRVHHIIEQTHSVLSSGNFNLDYIYNVSKELKLLWRDFNSFKEKNYKEIRNRYGENTLKMINRWTQNNGIDLNAHYSEFDNRVNSPVEMEKHVKATIKMCFGVKKSEIELKVKEKHFFFELSKLIQSHGLKDCRYFINKVTFYCNVFLITFKKLIESHYYDYFLYDYNSEDSVSKDDYFRCCKNVLDIYEHVYDEALVALKRDLLKYHIEFETKFFESNTQLTEPEQVIYEFGMPCPEFNLIKEKLFAKTIELIPELQSKLNEVCTSFDYFHDFAILKSQQNEFFLFFHLINENNLLRGVIVYVKNL